MEKIVATDYKGKHFVLQDDNLVDPAFEYVIDYINVDMIINNDKALKEHIADCIYYGIPAYSGNNKELNDKIARLSEELEKDEI